jgi:hypothetical protein
MNQIRTILLWATLGALQTMHAQTAPKKITFTGAARSYFFGDKWDQETAVPDTVTIPLSHSGHVLADLGMHIRPNPNMEIAGMVRVRNDYGGFWGSGVSFDVRQLMVKGVIGGVVRYQLGDINYRMTKFTMWNPDQELMTSAPTIFRQQFDVLNYDHFYDQENSWRQQGGAAEWGLVFNRWIKELQFHAVATRNKASNNSNVNDRLFTGGNVQLVQSKWLQLGVNYVNLFDVSGTSRNQTLFQNPVLTGTADFNWTHPKFTFHSDVEWGNSKTTMKNDAEAPGKEGNFVEANASITQPAKGWKLFGSVSKVSVGFNSPGAQTKRIDFSGQPEAFQRVGNEQSLRPYSVLDIMRESAFYNLQLQPYLMEFAPKYDNITPYGAATPNRQGFAIGAAWHNASKTFHAQLQQTMSQETKGEGTLEAREFQRTEANIQYESNPAKTDIRKWAIQANWRMDQTNRSGTEYYRGVDLATSVGSLGMECEIFKKLDVLVGWQYIAYQGFDFTAVRNDYAEIFNFIEYDVDGKEIITAGGLRYRFGERAFLSAQVNLFDIQDQKQAANDYKVRQLMILYQINF